MSAINENLYSRSISLRKDEYEKVIRISESEKRNFSNMIGIMINSYPDVKKKKSKK